MAEYIYSLSSDFGGNLYPSQLVNEIENDPGISPTCQYINTAGDNVSIVFSAGLSGGEVIVLNSLISSHVAASDATTYMTSTGADGTKTIIRTNQSTNRIIDIPDANDTIVLTGSAATLTNKTISGASNTISNINASNITSGTLNTIYGGTGATTFTAGSWLQGNGTGAIIAIQNNMNANAAPTVNDDASAGYSVGSRWFDTTADQEYVCLDSTATAAVWNGSSGSGETNTASSAGGTSIFKNKVGVDLVFKGLTATSTKIALAANTNDVGIDVTEANLTLNNIGGTLGVTKGGTGATTLTSGNVLVGAGTSTVTTTKVAPTGAFVGTTDTQTLTNKTLTSPVISTIVNTGTLTLPTSTDTLVGRATTDTLTNKTLAATTNNLQARSLSFDNGTTTITCHAQLGPSSVGSVLTTLSATTARFVAPWVSSVVTAGSTVASSTTSVTYVAMDSMSVTAPATGIYLICWNTTVRYGTNNSTIRLSLFNNGTQIGQSTTLVGGTTASNYNTPASGTTYATVTSGTAVVLRWNTSAGTATCESRSISLILLNT